MAVRERVQVHTMVLHSKMLLGHVATSLWFLTVKSATKTNCLLEYISCLKLESNFTGRTRNVGSHAHTPMANEREKKIKINLC